MIFDLTPLTASSIWFLGISFCVTFFLLSWLLGPRKPFLRNVTDKTAVYYGGVVLVAVITILAYIATADAWLRIGLSAVGFLVLIIGIIDESIKLSPRTQLIWQIIIAIIVVSCGWTIRHVSNPVAPGVISFIPIIGGVVAVVWLLLLMNAVNWIDGSDGLASGVSSIAFATLAAVCLLPSVQDNHTLTLALIGLGASVGFLIWNFYPARVHLGTTGAWFLGIYLGLVAIVGGGKIVTTLLVLALPLLDLVFVVGQRLVHRRAPWKGDTENHLHYRLKSWGLKPRLIFMGVMAFSSILGVSAIALQTTQKIMALGVAAGVFMVMSLYLIILRPVKHKV